jgi:hypothetical protein
MTDASKEPMTMSDNPDATPRALANEDVLDIGTAAPRSAAILDGVMAEALGLAMYNIVAAQQQGSIARQAAISMAAAGMMALCFAADGSGEGDGDGDTPAASPASAATAAAPAVVAAAVPGEDGDGGGGGTSEGGGGGGGAPRAATQIDPVIVDAVNQVMLAALSPEVVKTSADGKAAKLVAASAALAIADAADALRGATTLAIVNSAMALTRYVMTGDDRYAAAATAGQAMVTDATHAYERIASAAVETVKGFPTG